MNRKIEAIVGLNIRRERIRNKMTQDILAAKLQLRGCDISRSAVAKIEAGQRHVYPDEVIVLRDILKTDFETILHVENVEMLYQQDQRYY